mmetsp:Transcript_42133/g.82759  ORF Transcript_42133/g.82759 Transcript_42133/m.82759 type:complete len:204 (-) Transcript_42133:2004-2615(-)
MTRVRSDSPPNSSSLLHTWGQCLFLSPLQLFCSSSSLLLLLLLLASLPLSSSLAMTLSAPLVNTFSGPSACPSGPILRTMTVMLFLLLLKSSVHTLCQSSKSGGLSVFGMSVRSLLSVLWVVGVSRSRTRPPARLVSSKPINWAKLASAVSSGELDSITTRVSWSRFASKRLVTDARKLCPFLAVLGKTELLRARAYMNSISW